MLYLKIANESKRRNNQTYFWYMACYCLFILLEFVCLCILYSLLGARRSNFWKIPIMSSAIYKIVRQTERNVQKKKPKFKVFGSHRRDVSIPSISWHFWWVYVQIRLVHDLISSFLNFFTFIFRSSLLSMRKIIFQLPRSTN